MRQDGQQQGLLRRRTGVGKRQHQGKNDVAACAAWEQSNDHGRRANTFPQGEDLEPQKGQEQGRAVGRPSAAGDQGQGKANSPAKSCRPENHGAAGHRGAEHQRGATIVGWGRGEHRGEGLSLQGEDRESEGGKSRPAAPAGVYQGQGRGPVVTTGYVLGPAPAGHLRGRLALNAGLTGRVSRSRSRRGRRGSAVSLRLWSALVEAFVLVPGFGLRLAASPGLLDRARRVPSGLRGLCARGGPSQPGQGGLK